MIAAPEIEGRHVRLSVESATEEPLDAPIHLPASVCLGVCFPRENKPGLIGSDYL
jgi:hypothetical protein